MTSIPDNNSDWRLRSLELIKRFGLTTNAVTYATVGQHVHSNTISKGHRELVEEEILTQYPLRGVEKYFRLGPKGAKRLGVPLTQSGWLGPQALPERYAVLTLWWRHSSLGQRLTDEELLKAYSWMQRRYRQQPHLKDYDKGGLLTLVRLDAGTDVGHIATKAKKAIQNRYVSCPEFCQFIEQRQLQLIVVTSTLERCEQLQAALDRKQIPVATQAISIPELEWLLH